MMIQSERKVEVHTAAQHLGHVGMLSKYLAHETGVIVISDAADEVDA